MPNTQFTVNANQKRSFQEIVAKINKKGGFITASILGNTLRAQSPFPNDLKLLKEEITKIK
ncbi:hypothetical protein [uncultured Chryseobacterium sp.]|uniref:hypothetical protein n=1 Tax=uncultured Chryseobacterium sp. TaxID=259322 RepID=UPI0025FE198A|nr:hypothetical protein [uncultured Chryseobacterium sp.]